MRLDRLRDEVRHELSQTGALSKVNDAAIDHALAQSLVLLTPYYPSVRAVLTLTSTDAEQDLNLLATPRIGLLEEVWYPYFPDQPNQISPVRHALIGASTIQFFGIAPQVGEQLLAIYRARYALAGLYTSTADTLPDDPAYEHPLLLAAVQHLLMLEHTRLLFDKDKAIQSVAAALREFAATLHNDAIDAALSLGARPRNPAWSALGL